MSEEPIPPLTKAQREFLEHTLNNPYDGGKCHQIVKDLARAVLDGKNPFTPGLLYIENGACGYEIKPEPYTGPNGKYEHPVSYVELKRRRDAENNSSEA